MVTGSEWSRVELAAALLKSLDREYRLLLEETDARQSILQRFAEQSSWVRGKQVCIEENGSRIEGSTDGLDDRGFLQVRTAQGLADDFEWHGDGERDNFSKGERAVKQLASAIAAF
jgi:BirA family transcriptional regulator, biotin operon repressor / biotin---[acetyl-CoA-carboxylase] ligase